MSDRLIGERSTHQVKCLVCNQTYGNAAEHECPYAGVRHRDMHLDLRQSLDDARARIAWLEREVEALRAVPSPSIAEEKK